MVLSLTINEINGEKQASGSANSSLNCSFDPLKFCWVDCLTTEPWFPYSIITWIKRDDVVEAESAMLST